MAASTIRLAAADPRHLVPLAKVQVMPLARLYKDRSPGLDRMSRGQGPAALQSAPRVRRVAFERSGREAASVDPDFSVRLAAIEHLDGLSRRLDDMIPRKKDH